jgi:hypothetical protein
MPRSDEGVLSPGKLTVARILAACTRAAGWTGRAFPAYIQVQSRPPSPLFSLLDGQDADQVQLSTAYGLCVQVLFSFPVSIGIAH